MFTEPVNYKERAVLNSYISLHIKAKNVFECPFAVSALVARLSSYTMFSVWELKLKTIGLPLFLNSILLGYLPSIVK